MVNLDDMISTIIFITFFVLTIAYFSVIQSPDRVELEALGSDIADKILTPGYLIWNITKTSIFVNASSAQNLYPIDMSIAFADGTKSNSIRARYHNNGESVGFMYANASTNEFVMLVNLSTGKNIFDIFYSDTDASPLTMDSDLAVDNLEFSNGDLYSELSSTGDIISVSYRDGNNMWERDNLYIGESRYEATSYTIHQVPVRIQYDFTDGSTTKTFRVYAFNPIIRVNISVDDYTWNTRWLTVINKTFTTSEIEMSGSNSLVFSGATDFVDLYSNPGITTTGITFSAKNMNASIYDSSDHREFNISNYTADEYEMFYHHGSYTNGKPYNDIRVYADPVQLVENKVTGVGSSKIITFNNTGYNDLKSMLGSSKDFNIQIENTSDGTLLLDYGKSPANFTDVVVHRRTDNLLTTDYDFQKIIVRVKVWN